MSNSVRKNYAYSAFVQIYGLLISLATSPYISRKLGPEGVGINAYVIAVVSYFLMFGTLKSDFFSTREFIYSNKSKKVLWNIFFLRLTLMSIATFFYILYSLNSPLRIYFLWSLPSIFNAFIDVGWVYVANENFKVLAIRQFIIRTISFGLVFVLVRSKEDVVKFIALNSLTNLIVSIVIFAGVVKKYGPPSFNAKDTFKLLPRMLKLFLPELSISVYALLDRVMLGILSSKAEVGYYDIASRFPSLFLTLIGSMTPVMMARMSNMISGSRYDNFTNYVSKSFKFSFVMSAGMILSMLSIVKEFIPWFFGQEYTKSVILVNIKIFIVFFVALGVVAGHQSLISLKKESYLTLGVTIGAIVNFFLNSLLIPKSGAYGAAIASLIAEVIVTIVLYVFLSKFVNLIELLLSVKNILPAVLISGIFVYFLVSLHIWWPLRGIFSVIVYTLTCIIFDVEVKNEVLNILKKFLIKLKL
ncbi:MAG: flippase [Fervidobacterium sp.]